MEPRSMLPTLDRDEVVIALMTELRAQGFEVTVSDVVAATGIPAHEVERGLILLSFEYSGSQRVTESGEVLYRFPQGFPDRRRRRSRRRVASSVRSMAESIFDWLKKWGPLALLGGYLAIFLALPFPPALIVLAMLLGTWSDLNYQDRRDESRYVHKMVYAHLFGRRRAACRGKRRELLAVLSFLRSHQGLVSLGEIMAMTGRSLTEAQDYLNAMLVAFNGEPSVTERPTIVYRFTELMKSAHPRTASAASTPSPEVAARRDGSVKRKMRMISVANYTNLLFAVYYGVNSLKYLLRGVSFDAAGPHHHGAPLLFSATYSLIAAAHIAHPLALIFWFLGVVPAGIATTFSLLHFRVARRRVAWMRKKAERHLRRAVYAEVLSHPQSVDPAKIEVRDEAVPSELVRKRVASIMDELASAFSADIEDIGEGHYVYHFPEFTSELIDVESLRRSIEPSEFDLGAVIFDSRSRLI